MRSLLSLAPLLFLLTACSELDAESHVEVTPKNGALVARVTAGEDSQSMDTLVFKHLAAGEYVVAEGAEPFDPASLATATDCRKPLGYYAAYGSTEKWQCVGDRAVVVFSVAEGTADTDAKAIGALSDDATYRLQGLEGTALATRLELSAVSSGGGGCMGTEPSPPEIDVLDVAR